MEVQLAGTYDGIGATNRESSIVNREYYSLFATRREKER
jgi:hypothetical protein